MSEYSVWQILKNLNMQYNPFINAAPQQTPIFELIFKSLSREMLIDAGIAILTTVLIKYIWSIFSKGISVDCKIGEEKKHKKETSSGPKELDRTSQGLKDYLTTPPKIETANSINKFLLNDRMKESISRSPYSEVCKQQSISVNQYGDSKDKREVIAKVKENLLKALQLLEKPTESKEMGDGDASSSDLGYWSSREETIEAMRVLEIQEATQESKSVEVRKGGERSLSKYSNLNTLQSTLEKEVNGKPRKASVADQCREVASGEEIVESLRAFGIQGSMQGNKSAKVRKGGETTWSKYSNLNTAESTFEKEMKVKPRKASVADQYREVATREEIVEALRVLGIQMSMQESKREDISEDWERIWTKNPNLNTPESTFEKEIYVKPWKVSVTDQYTEVTNREEIIGALRVLGIQDILQGSKREAVSEDNGRAWLKFSNLNTPQSEFEKEMNVKPRKMKTTDQFKEVPKREEIVEALRVLGIQDLMQRSKRENVSEDGGRVWSKYPNLNTPQSAFEKEVYVKPRKTNSTDQFKEAPKGEEIVEALRVLGTRKSMQESKSEGVSNDGESTGPKYSNSNQAQSIFEDEVDVKSHMPSSANECTQVDSFSEVATTNQALLSFQELERNGKYVTANNALVECKGLNACKRCCKHNETQNSLKLSLMDIRSASLQQKVTCDCASVELFNKRGKESASLLNLTANGNTINIELLLNRNSQIS